MKSRTLNGCEREKECLVRGCGSTASKKAGMGRTSRFSRTTGKKRSRSTQGGTSKRLRRVEKALANVEWKYKSETGTIVALKENLPQAFSITTINQGTGGQQRNGNRVFLQNGVLAFQLRWAHASNATAANNDYPCRVIIGVHLSDVDGTGTTADGNPYAAQVCTDLFGTNAPNTYSLMRYKQETPARSKYWIRKDFVYHRPNYSMNHIVGSYVDQGSVLTKKLTFTVKNYEAIYRSLSTDRPQNGNPFILFISDTPTSTGHHGVNVDWQAKTIFTENMRPRKP